MMNRYSAIHLSLNDFPVPVGKKTGWPWNVNYQQSLFFTKYEEKLPKISIVTPSYNQGQYLEETIRSVLLQLYPNLEFVIIDGGSTDNSVELIQKYEPWLKFWTSEPDNGQSDAINKGFNHTDGDILAYLNSDDYLLPGSLEEITKTYHANKDAGGWFGGCLRVNQDGERITERWPQDLSASGLADWDNNWVQQPACFFSRQAWNACGPFDESLYCAFDFDFWLKLAKKFNIVKVNHLLAAARIHTEAKTSKRRKLMHAETWTVKISQGFEKLALQEMVDRLGEPEIQEMESMRVEVSQLKNKIEYLLQESSRIRNATFLSSSVYMSNEYMKIVYRAYEEKDWDKIKPALWGALRHDPTWLSKKGFLSIFAQAYGLWKR